MEQHNTILPFSKNEADYSQAIALCEKYGIDVFIKKFPQGFNTIVGEGGVNLSSRQQQIVAISRALFSNLSLLLLDEATSAMDRNTENFILNLLNTLKAEMTILMVTHRIKTASKSDFIYILDKKTISHIGTPNELLKSSNLYSDNYHDLITV